MGKSLPSTGRRRPVFIADFRPSGLGLGPGPHSPAPAAAQENELPVAGITKSDVEELDATAYGMRNSSLRVVRDGLRYNFPPAGEVAEGGTSDGYCYRIPFAAGRLDRTYDLIVSFLAEQGYKNIPLPADANELRQFRLPPKLRHQLSLFGEDGYVHNPVKILFPTPTGRRGALILELYHEAAEGHLLRFHRR